MAEPLEFWTYVLTNFTVFGFGAVLTALSYLAYRADPERRSLRNSTVGFGLLTVGGLVAPAYQLALTGRYELGGRELLAVQSVEGLFFAAGFGMLFYSLYRRTSSSQHRVQSVDPSEESPDGSDLEPFR